MSAELVLMYLCKNIDRNYKSIEHRILFVAATDIYAGGAVSISYISLTASLA